MQDKKALEIIEVLNTEYTKSKESSEYIRGRKLLHLFQYVITLDFKRIVHALKFNYKVRSIKNRINAGEANRDEVAWRKHLRLGPQDKKVVVYTCITGEYDNPLAPYFYNDNIDYRFFTDNEQFLKQDVVNEWKVMDMPCITKKYDNSTANRYVKFHPFELFGNAYDYSIYIDGNIRPISDLSEMVFDADPETGLAFHKHSQRDCIYEEVKMCKISGKGNWKNLKRQVEGYKTEGYPVQNGLLECNVIVTDLKNNKAKEILTQWWKELLRSGSGRDQISLPYVLWKNHIPVYQLARLGNNVEKNPKLRKYEHNVDKR